MMFCHNRKVTHIDVNMHDTQRVEAAACYR